MVRGKERKKPKERIMSCFCNFVIVTFSEPSPRACLHIPPLTDHLEILEQTADPNWGPPPARGPYERTSTFSVRWTHEVSYPVVGGPPNRSFSSTLSSYTPSFQSFSVVKRPSWEVKSWETNSATYQIHDFKQVSKCPQCQFIYMKKRDNTYIAELV